MSVVIRHRCWRSAMPSALHAVIKGHNWWPSQMAKLSFLAATLMLGACATDRPLAFKCPGFEKFRTPVGAPPAEHAGSRTANALSPLALEIATTFAPAASGGAPSADNFLILSGGGQWGAFGSGFLTGWSKNGAGAAERPQRFNLVTGVSTGALQATSVSYTHLTLPTKRIV